MKIRRKNGNGKSGAAYKIMVQAKTFHIISVCFQRAWKIWFIGLFFLFLFLPSFRAVRWTNRENIFQCLESICFCTVFHVRNKRKSQKSRMGAYLVSCSLKNRAVRKTGVFMYSKGGDLRYSVTRFMGNIDFFVCTGDDFVFD